MAGRIPPEFIDQLLARTDIVDVVNQRVPLKRAGSEYTACCPFHDEKTPSFTVSPTKQFYHCFGCGAHGTALGFLMEYDRLSFPEAVEALAGEAGVEVPHEEGAARGPDLRPLYEVLERAARFYSRQLRDHPEAPRAVEYLHQRGLSDEIGARFRIGFAPPGWGSLRDALGGSGEALARLRQAGLITEGERGTAYDRLRDRITFPIRDARGRVVGFGGRILPGHEDEKGSPKYLNSPETPVFHKGRELYGLYEARQANRELTRLLVVEGYMDVVALAQHGITNAVATLGTATTADHLEKLFRVTPEVVFCFDGDRAGRAAGWKALETALPLLREGRQARFMFLPEGEDPDSLVRREGAAAFAERLAGATPLSEFLFGHLGESVDMESLDGRARLAELARPLLARLPAGPFRELMHRRLGELVGLPGAATGPPRGGRPRAHPRPGRHAPLKPGPRAIALLLREPALASLPGLPMGWARLETPGARLLQQLLETLAAHPDIGPAALVERWGEGETRERLQRLLQLDPGAVGDAGEEFRGALQALSRQAEEQERARLTARARPSAMTEEEKQRLRELYARRTAQPDEDSTTGKDQH